ncbi:protein acetyltransferase [[Clostridium] ultunense Esp]|nr:protein acetyltransferase [[Clostridium] ultunense Esp]
MEHRKVYHKKEYETPTGKLIVEGPVSPETIITHPFHEGLKAFRPPQEQQEALYGIALLPEGRIILARDGETIVGYVTFLYPDPLERWSEEKIENVLELGAIEVAPPYRGQGVGKKLLEVSFMDDHMEDYLIFTTEYYWHWDLKGTGLSVWEYRNLMEKMMGSAGLEWFATDDPEICSHPANCLMVRIGKRVPLETIQAFDRLRFRYRYMY